MTGSERTLKWRRAHPAELLKKLKNIYVFGCLKSWVRSDAPTFGETGHVSSAIQKGYVDFTGLQILPSDHDAVHRAVE